MKNKMQTTNMMKNTYLSTEKMVTTMNRMKVAVLLAAFAAMPVCLRAQSEGVGVTAPQASFHVHSYTEILDNNELEPMFPTGGNGLNSGGNGATLDEHNYATTLLLTNTNTGAGPNDGLLIRQYNNNVTVRQQEQGSFQIVNSNESGKFIMNSAGNFGLGNTSTGVKFNVEGGARFTQGVSMLSALTVSGTLTVGSGFSCDASGNLKVKHLKVTLTDWPDYVFGGDHALIPLGELEAYIGEHQHLPGIPTAAEVEQEGADLGEMNRLLMEKVEELTLYIIDLQKQIDELKDNK